MGRTGRDETVARGDKSVARRNEAIGLTGRGETVIASAGRDKAIARCDRRTAPGYCVVVVDIRSGTRQVAARATIGLRGHPH